MIRFKTVVLAFLIFITSIVFIADSHAVMSVDLGTEFMKIAVVKPGIPMEIALNK
jgi:hypoxia up-regulated 1